MKYIFILLLLVIIVFVGTIGYFGAFHKVEVLEKKTSSYSLVYQKHKGDYSQVGPLMDQIYNKITNDLKLKTTQGFGLYYDDPKIVPKEELRSLIGCILENSEDLEKASKEFSVATLPQTYSVVAEFPYKGMLSIILGVFKVYPLMMPYLKENDYKLVPIMEIYDQPNQKILYIAPISLEMKFFDDLIESK